MTNLNELAKQYVEANEHFKAQEKLMYEAKSHRDAIGTALCSAAFKADSIETVIITGSHGVVVDSGYEEAARRGERYKAIKILPIKKLQ